MSREPSTIIVADDPVTCAIYAKNENLLEIIGWNRFKRIAKRQKNMLRLSNQEKLRSIQLAPTYNMGFKFHGITTMQRD